MDGNTEPSRRYVFQRHIWLGTSASDAHCMLGPIPLFSAQAIVDQSSSKNVLPSRTNVHNPLTSAATVLSHETQNSGSQNSFQATQQHFARRLGYRAIDVLEKDVLLAASTDLLHARLRDPALDGATAGCDAEQRARAQRWWQRTVMGASAASLVAELPQSRAAVDGTHELDAPSNREVHWDCLSCTYVQNCSTADARIISSV